MFCASEDIPADSKSAATPWTPDQLSAVGPPGAAHWVMTSWATRTEAEVRAVVSIAASCASAPSGVCGNPVATPTSPTSIGAGISSVPVSPDDRLPGCAASSGASGSCLSASWSCADCAESDPALVRRARSR